MPYLRQYPYIESLVNSSRVNPYVDTPIWSYPDIDNKKAPFFAYCSLILIVYNIRKYDLCKITSKDHETTPLLHLFMKLREIRVNCTFYSQINPPPP